jgi:hypothetical protein
LDELDSVVSPSYRRHIGLRDRDLSRLEQDIAEHQNVRPGRIFTSSTSSSKALNSPRD